MSDTKIRVYPDSILQTKAAEIENIDGRVVHLAKDMAQTMYAAPGVGLAAPQVGVSDRLIVIDVTNPAGKKGLITLINPEIIEMEGHVVEEEGCLSLPGIRENVSRAARILARGYDLNERQREIEATGLLAVALQHEIDHLEGILFIDRISRLKRGIAQRKMRKLIHEAQASAQKDYTLF
jgi:peptide deformylase